MAEAGGGNFYYIENPDQIPQLFAKELQGLLATTAQGLEVRFAGTHGVAVAGVVGYRPSGTPGNVSLTLPDIYSGEVKSLVLELAVGAGFAGERPLGALTLTYSDAATGTEVTATRDLTVTVSGESALLGAPEDPEVLKQLYLARSEEALDQAVEQADRRDYTGGGATLARAAAPLAMLAEAAGDAELGARAAELQQRAAMLQEQQYDAAARKQMKARSYQSRTGRHQDR